MLESLERANLFVVPLDDTAAWFRYHHLFADVLRARICSPRNPTWFRCCTGAPATGTSSTDLIEDAVRHALAGGTSNARRT